MNKIPRKIKILGHSYSIIVHEEEKTGNSSLGTHWGVSQKIYLNAKQNKEMIESTLLHEVIEAVNYHLSLKLPHQMIIRLETALYQVLKENPIWITKA